MNVLILLNDAPYGSEKAYNGLRLAMTLQKDHPSVQIRLFLMADAVTCALPQQATAQGYYNIERMMRSVVAKSGAIKACGTCADARGVRSVPLIEGVELSTMSDLAQWTIEADKVFTF